MGVVVFLQPQPQRPIISIDTIPRHPGSWNARVEGALEHLLRQLRLGGKGALLRNPRALAARCVVGPRFGEREFTIEQDMALGARLGHKHPNLAMFHASGGPALLARHSRRMLAFFEEARLIDDQYGLRSTEILDHRGAQIVAQGIGIP